jgi:hypothetical protein
MRQHGTSTAVIGLVQAAIMAGGVLGGMVAPRLPHRTERLTERAAPSIYANLATDYGAMSAAEAAFGELQPPPIPT